MRTKVSYDGLDQRPVEHISKTSVPDILMTFSVAQQLYHRLRSWTVALKIISNDSS